MKYIGEAVAHIVLVGGVMLCMALAAGALDDYIYDYDYHPKMVMVNPGDTVWGIAVKELPNQNRWDLDRMVYEIMQHNDIANSQLANIQPGIMLTIPLYIKK